MRVAGLEGVESKAEILPSSWYDQYLCSYTETVFLVIEISHSYIIFGKKKTQNQQQQGTRLVTSLSFHLVFNHITRKYNHSKKQ